MDYAAKFTAVAQMSHNFFTFTEHFCHLVVTSKTLKSFFWIGANYHYPVDLPDTSGLDWREAIIRCLESIYPPVQNTARPRARFTTFDHGEIGVPHRRRATACCDV